MEELKERNITEKINSGERYFNGAGCKSFFNLLKHIENIYSESDFEHIMFIDDFDICSNFLIKKINNIPNKFYVINIQKIQKNISSSNHAVFEKSYYDVGFVKTERLKLALELGEILNIINKFYKNLNIKIRAKIIKDENMVEKCLVETIENMLNSENIAYEIKESMGDETIELEFLLAKSDDSFTRGAYVSITSDKIMFSITGGLENILMQVFNSDKKKAGFIF